MNRALDLSDVARNKLTMPDAYLSKDLEDENLIELKGAVLGYAERDVDEWKFHRPRRLPEHLTNVYRVEQSHAEVVRTLISSQTGTQGLYIGDLLAGEHPLPGVPVYLPSFALSHHIGTVSYTHLTLPTKA